MKIPKLIQDELQKLEKEGVPHSFEYGGRHIKIHLSGRFAGILPIGTLKGSDQRSSLNIRSQIRRLARELTAQTQPQ
jgi:hypothetical protein